MRVPKVVVAFVCVAAMLPLAWSQQDSSIRPGLRGQINPVAEEAKSSLPRAVAEESSVNANVAPTTGKIVVNFSIKLVTPVPAGSSLICGVDSVVAEFSSTVGETAQIIEQASSKATVSGSTATCAVSIPYSWYLLTPTKDTASLQYSLAFVNPTSGVSRSSSQFVIPFAGSIKVPASGTTSTFTVTTTI